MSKARLPLFLLVCLFAVVWFGNLGQRHLVRPDEGRYAEIAREMALSGDWVTPRLNGIRYFEKPPLQYWATAAAYRLFGEHEWSARLWTGLTGFLTVLVTGFAGRRLFGPTAGLFAAVALAGFPYWVLAGHFNSLDMGVSFFLTLTLCGFLLAQTLTDEGATRRFMLLAWAAAALAVLSKGLIGIVLPGLVLVVYSLVVRDFAVWRRLSIVEGLLLFLLITAPWFVLVSLSNPEFPRFFFLHEHFERFLTKVHRRDHPWYDFVPLLAVGVGPFLVSLFPAAAVALRAERQAAGFRPALFSALWAVVIFVFFSLSHSKLPGYILPIFPALALVLGRYLAQVHPARLSRETLVMALLALVAIVFAAVAWKDRATDDPELYGRYARWLMAAAFFWLAALATAFFASRSGRRLAALLALGAAGLVSTQLVVSGHEELAPLNSGYDFARKLTPLLSPDSHLYCVDMYDQTLPFYLKRTCTLVDYEDEMAFGLRLEPALRGPDLETFMRRFPREANAVAILKPERYEALAAKLPHRLLVRDREHVAIAPPQVQP